MLTANMKMIAECADKLAHLGEKLFNETEMGKMKIGQTTEFSCPEGYEFRDENGNVINATKIVLEKKKKEYPKTYEECCKVLGIEPTGSYATGYKHILVILFQELLIVRDAYWKIAGEEMGLGKPWEPDWATYSGLKHCIIYSDNEIKWRCKSFVTEAKILAFPTEEMRDAFYENFKELIEQCKELL
jgi:hypothetical protein